MRCEMLDLSFCLESYLFAGYHVPKSRGRPPEPSTKPSAIPAWSMSKHYKTVPPKSKAKSAASKALVDLAEAMDEGYFEPPENPSESSTSRSTSAAAQRPWVEHPWEPTDEDLT